MKEFSKMEKILVDAQYKLQEGQERWQSEKAKLHKEVDEAKKAQMQEKDKIAELLAEVSAFSLSYGYNISGFHRKRYDFVMP